MDHGIVFIHIGRQIPQYTHESLAQARLFNRCPIYLLAEQAALAGFRPRVDLEITHITCESIGLSEKHREFRENSTLDKAFRDGFWTFTTERFFLLETFMAQRGLTHVFHVENDNLLYVDLETLLPVFAAHFPNMAGTFDNNLRCVPAFVYVRNATSLGHLTTFINRAFASRASNNVNDMVFFGEFGHHAGPRFLGPLPVVTRDYPRPLGSVVGHTAADPGRYSNLLEETGGIFDANALGQYLGGIDPRNAPGRNTVGFINESCIFDPSAYTYFWQTDSQQRRVPWLQAPQGKPWRINNIHVHSKIFEPFRSRRDL